MYPKLIFATNNAHKVAEVKKILGQDFNVFSLSEAGINIDIPEPFATLEENAATKSATIFNITGQDCFSEDTGLFVDGLNGEPGVKSARYAGEPSSNEANIRMLLNKLGDNYDRKARFRTVISLMQSSKEYQFEGICEGVILREPAGQNGFGYDAIFMPDGSKKSFAQMEADEKNLFSHRKKAMDGLIRFLHENNICG